MKRYIFMIALMLAMLCLMTGCFPATTPNDTVTGDNSDPNSSTGWQEANGNKYYLDEAGNRLTGWQTLAEKRYYFDGQGVLQTGWLENAGSRYWLGADGVLHTGRVEAEGKAYLQTADGIVQTGGWVDDGSLRYYVNSDGSLYTGWLELDGNRYYLKDDGTMARGKWEINGVANYFTSTGAYILLVNPWNPLPEGYQPELKELSTAVAVDGMKVDASCYDALVKMVQDCGKQSHQVCVLSSYRSVEYQEGLFNRKVNYYLGLGCSEEEAKTKAATIVAVPGTSEHHLGLAVDIIDTQLWNLVEEQENLEGQKWLMENCWRYGFILRYPKDKIEITGIIYEPWHYRYVGEEVAKELHESGLTLEEYIDSLS